MLRTRTDHLTKVVQTLYLVYIPPNETGSPQTAHLCILPSQLQTWIPSLLLSSLLSTPPWYSPSSSSPLISSISFAASSKCRSTQHPERRSRPRLRLQSLAYLHPTPPCFPRLFHFTL